jgi:hypothetical protein
MAHAPNRSSLNNELKLERVQKPKPDDVLRGNLFKPPNVRFARRSSKSGTAGLGSSRSASIAVGAAFKKHSRAMHHSQRNLYSALLSSTSNTCASNDDRCRTIDTRSRRNCRRERFAPPDPYRPLARTVRSRRPQPKRLAPRRPKIQSRTFS